MEGRKRERREYGREEEGEKGIWKGGRGQLGRNGIRIKSGNEEK